MNDPLTVPARDGIEAQRGLNDIFPGDPYPVRDQLKRGLDALRAQASRGKISSADVFNLTDPLMDILARTIPAPSVAEAAEAAEPVAFMDEEGNLFAKSNMPIAEILRALPTPPVGRKLLPLYTHPAPPPVVPSGLEALVERLRMLASGKAAVNSNGDVDARWFYGSFSDAANALATLIAERDEALALAGRLNGSAELQTLMQANNALGEFAAWVETWVANPVTAYSVQALDGLFAMTRDRLAAIRSSATKQEKADV